MALHRCIPRLYQWIATAGMDSGLSVFCPAAVRSTQPFSTVPRSLSLTSARMLHFSAPVATEASPNASDSLSGSSVPGIPVTERNLAYPPPYVTPREIWLESLDRIENHKTGLVPLHPEIFAQFPRIDIIHQNVKWQSLYNTIDYTFARNRAEMPGGGRKPWPQKGTGRARHGSIRSPLWHNGGRSKGPRGPKSFFYLLPQDAKLKGLKCTLSVKLAQNDLHVVESFDIPSEDPTYIQALATKRNWGLSILFVDDTDIMPTNIALACAEIPSFTLMPVYGLNVYSMLKHETLVLTRAALERIEERILRFRHRMERTDIRRHVIGEVR
ncbi:39S ribosomal protein L4, mitochondrial-like [Paramacrobiotus metropolitanus]|uniref:39S ribosomal protein L4, mitochondrial-like n=1 Tax=Paramacrobiotus metropolitanus TaxID=2943436 RepID=UPI002445D53F|nr:39S ribosomal protein L4, mitochondrial-like [Paramacrobiotus metropolitanus]